MEISAETKRKYFTETALALRREGYAVEDVADGGPVPADRTGEHLE